MKLCTKIPQALLLAATAVLASAIAQAAVTISTGATKNMVCSAGVCTPTHKAAVLNITDLQNLLATSNVTVTTGSGSLAAQTLDIIVNGPVTWSSANTLKLDAHQSVTINKSVSVTGTGGVSLVTDDGGTGGVLSFGPKGHVTFASLTSSLAIDGAAYTLVGNIATLASDITANPTGNFALAANYDATGDGTYQGAPVSTEFGGTFEGLGNTISSLSIANTVIEGREKLGLFEQIVASHHTAVADLRLTNIAITCPQSPTVGGLAGVSGGLLVNDSVSGTISGTVGHCLAVGGLVGTNNGTIRGSDSTTNVEGGAGLVGLNRGSISDSYATGTATGGGLVTDNMGSIDSSFATGAVSGNGGYVGGLVSENQGTITNSYATGAINCSCQAAGGLVGYGEGKSIGSSYSTGEVLDGSSGFVGGLIGEDFTDNTDAYWDLTTSGITSPSQGAGNEANAPGITGLTTSQLQSGLPAGFDPAVWGQSPPINGGLPYLLANPPP